MRVSGQVLSTGTGFVANAPRGPVLITNRHNVTGRNQETGHPLSPTGGVPTEVVIMHNRANLLGRWVARSEPLYSNGQPLWIEHPGLGARADFVALSLTQLAEVQLYAYTLGVGDPAILSSRRSRKRRGIPLWAYGRWLLGGLGHRIRCYRL